MRRETYGIQIAAILGAGLLAGTLAGLNPLLSVVLLAGVVVVPLVLQSPFAALLSFMVVLFIRPAELIPGLSGAPLAKVLAISAAGLWGLSKLIRQDLTIPKSPWNGWMIALVGAILISSATGTSPGESYAQLNDVFVKILVLYILILDLVNTPKRATRFFLVCGILTSVVGGWSAQAQWRGVVAIEGSRAGFVGLLGDPNDTALVILMYLPLAVTMMLDTKGATRFLAGLMSFAAFMGMFATESRGGIIGLFGAVWFMLRQRVKSRVLTSGLFVVAALGLVVLSGIGGRESGGTILQGEIDTSSQERLDSWYAAVRMFLFNPVTGVGFGRFVENWGSYVVNPIVWFPHDTHNSYLKVLAETGILGIVPFMALMLLTLRTGWQLYYTPLKGSLLLRAVGRGLLPCTIGFFVGAFFLSQCWGWFFFIMLTQTAALDRIWLARMREGLSLRERWGLRLPERAGMELASDEPDDQNAPSTQPLRVARGSA